MKKILVANSGGLDSAMICRKLMEDGYEVYSVYINSHSLGWEQSMLSAKKTAEEFCGGRHHVIEVNWGYTPNHYEDENTFIMYDDAVAQDLDTATLPFLWSGPANMGMIIMSMAVSYAKTLGINEVCGGFAGRRSPEMYDIYNQSADANLNLRWRPKYIAPYGSMNTEEALAFTGYSEEEFPWVVKSVPGRV
jgi:7-cyano-7-deazaguanine synthase in queuosine biosynthesis